MSNPDRIRCLSGPPRLPRHADVPSRPRCARAGGEWLLESLEPRLLLAVAPVFEHALDNSYYAADGAITLGIDGYDADGDALTITATTSNPNVTAYVPTGNRFAELDFNDSNGDPMGWILVELFDDRSPTATDRFVTLATNHVNGDGTLDPYGVPFYTDVEVHRIIQGFMVQTGGGPSGLGAFPDSFDDSLRFSTAGVLAMANSGADTNDCGFFITADQTSWLNEKHVIFGQMVSGWDTYDTLINLPTDANDRPLQVPFLAVVQTGYLVTPQEGTVTLQAHNNFAGNVNVTVRIQDPSGRYVEKALTVGFLGFTPPQDVHVASGGSTSFIAGITKLGLSVNLAVSASDSLAVVSANSTTYQVNITAPAAPARMFAVQVTATFDTDIYMSRTFYVFSQGADDPLAGPRVAPEFRGEMLDAQRVGNLLYVASFAAGLCIYDLANPNHPVLVGSYETAAARGVVVDGQTAFVADTGGGLVALDVSDPADIQFLDSATRGQIAVALALDGDVAYVAEYSQGVTSYDVSNPANIVQLDNLVTLTTGVSFAQAVDVAVDGDYLYVSDQTGIIAVLNASNPANLTYVTHITSAEAPWGMDFVRDRLYVADQMHGLRVYDMTDPAHPAEYGLVQTGHYPWLVKVYNGYAVLGRENGFAILDVAMLSDAIESYIFQTPGYAGKAAVADDFFVLPALSDGLVLMDAAPFGNVRLTTPATVSQVDKGQPYRFEWPSGRADTSLNLWSCGPTGWTQLATGLAAAAGQYDWDTGTAPAGWYCAAAKVKYGQTWSADPAMGPGWLKVNHVPPPAPLAAATEAQTPAILFQTPTPDQQVLAGQPFEVRWETHLADGKPAELNLWACDEAGRWLPITAQAVDAAARSCLWDTTGVTPGAYTLAATLQGAEGLWYADNQLEVLGA